MDEQPLLDEKQQIRRPQRSRLQVRAVARIAVALASVCGLIAYATHGSALRPTQSTVAYESSTPAIRPLLSVVLPVDTSSSDVAGTIAALLATTAGPYELIAVFDDGAEEQKRIIDEIVSTHAEERERPAYTANYTAAAQLGLNRYAIVQARSNMAVALRRSIAQALGRYVVVHDRNARPLDFAWDRYLLRAFTEREDVFAVSSRCAFDLSSDDGAVQRSNVAGDCDIGQSATSIEDKLFVRDAVDLGPIMVDSDKLRQLASISTDMIELCLRGAEQFGWRCGYQPIAMDGVQSVPQRPLAAFSSLVRAASTSRTDITLTALTPDVAPITIVTGASQNHFMTLLQLYRSVRKHIPDARLVVYDLGFETDSINSLRQLPGLEYRRFEFEQFPAFFDISVKRGEYAWKVAIISDALREYGGIVTWLDGGDKVMERPVDFLRSAAHRGVFSPYSVGTTERWVYPATAEVLGMSTELRKESGMCNGAIMLFSAHDPVAVRTIAEPYRQCAWDQQCIAPMGSNLHNHRQDQAVFSVLMALQSRVCPREQFDDYPHSIAVKTQPGWSVAIQQDFKDEGSSLADLVL